MTAFKLMTVLVCGGRDYTDRARVFKLLDFNRAKIAMIVHGGAKGADLIADDWAYSNQVPCLAVPAEWGKFGKKAGFIRNEKMLSLGKPDLVVAFPGGAGTAMMVRLAKQAGIRVVEVDAPKADERMSPDERRGSTPATRKAVAERDAQAEQERLLLRYPDQLDHATQCALALHDGC